MHQKTKTCKLSKEKIRDMEFLDKFSSESTMTEKDALKLGAKVNKGLTKRYLEMEKLMRHAKDSS